MSPTVVAAVIMVALVPPTVAFYLVVESSRRRLLLGLHTPDEVEAVLAHRPWFISRGQLVAWEYLLAEAETGGLPKPHRRLSRVGPTGRRLWIVWQGAQPTPVFHPWTSAALFAAGGAFLVLPAYRSGAGALAVAEGLAILGLCTYLLAAGRLQRDDEDWQLGAALRPLLSADSQTRTEGLMRLARSRAGMEPSPAAA